ERLAGADHRDRKQHVVAYLCSLARARAAGMDDALAHLLQDRLCARERLVAAATHEGERAGFRTADAAGHRRVEEIKTRLCRGVVRGTRGIDIDGRAIDQERVL